MTPPVAMPFAGPWALVVELGEVGGEGAERPGRRRCRMPCSFPPVHAAGSGSVVRIGRPAHASCAGSSRSTPSAPTNVRMEDV